MSLGTFVLMAAFAAGLVLSGVLIFVLKQRYDARRDALHRIATFQQLARGEKDVVRLVAQFRKECGPISLTATSENPKLRRELDSLFQQVVRKLKEPPSDAPHTKPESIPTPPNGAAELVPTMRIVGDPGPVQIGP